MADRLCAVYGDTHKYFVFKSFAHYKMWFATSDIRTLHEVIRGSQAQKLKFDIDAAADDLDNLEDMPQPTDESHERFAQGLEWWKKLPVREWEIFKRERRAEMPHGRPED